MEEEIITIRTIADWGWWFREGETHKVKQYPYQATEGSTLNYCYCPSCVKERKGKKLYDMYEVVGGKHNGSIIPVVACKEVMLMKEE